MLKFLSIRDFVIVASLELDFSAGFTALTGETGAGKSILIDALSLALGERGDGGMVRAGCERAEISAEFDIAHLPHLQAWLKEQEIDGESGRGADRMPVLILLDLRNGPGMEAIGVFWLKIGHVFCGVMGRVIVFRIARPIEEPAESLNACVRRLGKV